jgi:hypothetical protein
MAEPRGWQSIGNVDGIEWEIKQKQHGRFFMMRPVGTEYDPDDPDYPHTLVELENGQPTGFQHNSEGRDYSMKFGTRDVIMAAARLALSL